MPKEDNPKVGGHCAGCDIDIGLPAARFCPYCGEQLESISSRSLGTNEESRITESREVDATKQRELSCVICGKTLGIDEPKLWCPFCGLPAHRQEFGKWVNKKNSCPGCGKQLHSDAFESCWFLKLVKEGKIKLARNRTIFHKGRAIAFEQGHRYWDSTSLLRISYSSPLGARGVILTGGMAYARWYSFDAEENGELAHYNIRLEQGSRLSSVTILRNAKLIYNDGGWILPRSKTMKEIVEEVRSRGIEPELEIEFCPSCGVENVILDPSFCACCGASLEVGSDEANARNEVDRQSSACIVCKAHITENLKEVETIAWCPLCGGIAHSRCLLDALERQELCPSCGNTLLKHDLADQLKKRRRGSAPRPALPQRKQGRPLGERCIVCDFQLNSADEIVRCPHCGNAAHRDHLLEWLHVKGICPLCGQHLSQNELKKEARESLHR